MNSSDIKFFHSGGGSNCDPLADLGGSRSACELTEGSGTLFNTLSPKKSLAGLVDYRCFYVVNTHATETLHSAKFYVDWERKSGSLIDVGIKRVNEIQTVQINGTQPPDEDDFMVLNMPSIVPTTDFTVAYSPDIAEWQGNFQTSMRGVDGLQDAIVSVAGIIGFPTIVVFTINFVGKSGNHMFSNLSIVTNSLTNQTVAVAQVKDGSPINVVACSIATVKVAPACVEFDYPLRGSPVELGDLHPGEEFPVWVRRTTPKNTRIYIKDKIRFNVIGSACDNSVPNPSDPGATCDSCANACSLFLNDPYVNVTTGAINWVYMDISTSTPYDIAFTSDLGAAIYVYVGTDCGDMANIFTSSGTTINHSFTSFGSFMAIRIEVGAGTTTNTITVTSPS